MTNRRSKHMLLCQVVMLMTMTGQESASRRFCWQMQRVRAVRLSIRLMMLSGLKKISGRHSAPLDRGHHRVRPHRLSPTPGPVKALCTSHFFSPNMRGKAGISSNGQVKSIPFLWIVTEISGRIQTEIKSSIWFMKTLTWTEMGFWVSRTESLYMP